MNTGKIKQIIGPVVDIEFNAAWHEFGTQQSYGPDTILVDLESTLTHEIGHTVGLEHSSVEAATMYPYGDSGEIQKRDLHRNLPCPWIN